MVHAVFSLQEGCGFNSHFLMEIIVGALSRLSSSLTQSNNMHVGSAGNSKLTVPLFVSM